MNLTPLDQPGRSFKGTVHASYNQLVAIFGFKPNVKNDDFGKINHSWTGQDEDGKTLSVWDYKGTFVPAEEPDKKLDWSVHFTGKHLYEQLHKEVLEV